METVDGADVGEDSLNHVAREGGARAGLLQEPSTENLQEEETPRDNGDRVSDVNSVYSRGCQTHSPRVPHWKKRITPRAKPRL